MAARTPKSSKPAPLCHVHDDAQIFNIDYIREKVCVPDSEYPLTVFEGKHYCLFHLPTKEKGVDKFNEIFYGRINDVESQLNGTWDPENTSNGQGIKHDFSYVWFPAEVDLSNRNLLARTNFNAAIFSAAANFSSVVFSSKTDFRSAVFLAKANFSSAKFSGRSSFHSAKFRAWALFFLTEFSGETSFNSAAFSSMAGFNSAIFSAKSYFRSTTFSSHSDFRSSEFLETSDTNFGGATIKSLDLCEAVVSGYLNFTQRFNEKRIFSDTFWLNLGGARIEDGKKISFHTARLEPSWFINVDASEFVFTDCIWQYADGKKLTTKTELEKSGNRNALLTQTCRQLATNYENTKAFEDASVFRLIANESKRLTGFGHKFWTLHWWYWLSSRYGESWGKALVVLAVLIFLLFPLAFTQTEFQVSSKNIPLGTVVNGCRDVIPELKDECFVEKRGLDLFWGGEALRHSLTTATFQNVDYRIPMSPAAIILTLLEKILAPLQAALLAFAVRRKFMQ